MCGLSLVAASGGYYSSLRCAGFYCGGFSGCGARPLGIWASVVVARGLSSCGSRAWLLCGMWDLPGPGIETVSPELAGGFLTTVPPGKSLLQHLEYSSLCYRVGPFCLTILYIVLIDFIC